MPVSFMSGNMNDPVTIVEPENQYQLTLCSSETSVDGFLG